MKYFIVSYRSIVFYIIIVLVYKIMGKREIGELSIIDLIVSLFIAEFVAISIENYKESIFMSIIPIIVIVLLQIISSKVSLKNKNTRDVIEGKPSVIINRGKINFKEMLKQRYNIDDLLVQLRTQSIKSIEEVDYAILEVNGKLSIFKKDDSDKTYPLPIIINGVLDEETLMQINKSEKWLNKELRNRKIEINNIFYCFYQNNSLYIIEKDKIKWQIFCMKIFKIVLVIIWKKYYFYFLLLY